VRFVREIVCLGLVVASVCSAQLATSNVNIRTCIAPELVTTIKSSKDVKVSIAALNLLSTYSDSSTQDTSTIDSNAQYYEIKGVGNFDKKNLRHDVNSFNSTNQYDYTTAQWEEYFFQGMDSEALKVVKDCLELNSPKRSISIHVVGVHTKENTVDVRLMWNANGRGEYIIHSQSVRGGKVLHNASGLAASLRDKLSNQKRETMLTTADEVPDNVLRGTNYLYRTIRRDSVDSDITIVFDAVDIEPGFLVIPPVIKPTPPLPFKTSCRWTAAQLRKGQPAPYQIALNGIGFVQECRGLQPGADVVIDVTGGIEPAYESSFNVAGYTGTHPVGFRFNTNDVISHWIVLTGESAGGTFAVYAPGGWVSSTVPDVAAHQIVKVPRNGIVPFNLRLSQMQLWSISWGNLTLRDDFTVSIHEVGRDL